MNLLILFFILLLIIISGYYYQFYYKNEHFNNYQFFKQLPNSYYTQKTYPNMKLQPQVIGCGARNTPCIGGTQVPIANPMPPIDISNNNIAPITIKNNNTYNNFNQNIIQVGVLYKIFGNFNNYIPLYYNNNEKFYFIYYQNNVMKLPKSNYGNNDELVINSKKYRVTIYETNTPQFVPYPY